MSTHAVPHDQSSAESAAAARAWNWAHSEDARRTHIELALTARTKGKVRFPVDVDPRVALFLDNKPTPVKIGFEALRKSMPKLDVLDVVLMREVPPAISVMMGKAGFSKVLPRQITGYWFGPHDKPPTMKPGWNPTGALLRPRAGSEEARVALALVQVDGWWRPLRYKAAGTYSFTLGIGNDEPWFFVPEQASDWQAERHVAKELVYFNADFVKQNYSLPSRALAEDDFYVGVAMASLPSSRGE